MSWRRGRVTPRVFVVKVSARSPIEMAAVSEGRGLSDCWSGSRGTSRGIRLATVVSFEPEELFDGLPQRFSQAQCQCRRRNKDQVLDRVDCLAGYADAQREIACDQPRAVRVSRIRLRSRRLVIN